MNELDILILFIILLCVGIGLRRGLVRALISAIGIYFTVVMAGYVYEPIGDTLSTALGRVGISMGTTGAHNLIYVLVVIAMTVAVELVSRATFEQTHISSLWKLDTLLGGVTGIFYGALWVSLFLVPGQYSIAQGSGTWYEAVYGSTLVPTLNSFFETAVLDVVSILFLNRIPRLYLNPISQRVSLLFLDLASFRFLVC